MPPRHRSRPSSSRTVIAVALLLAPALPAQEAPGRTPQRAVRPQLEAFALGERIRIDGVLDEATWSQAQPATGFTQESPNAGAPASRPTEVRVAYDPSAIYIGARLYDAPDSISAQLARRDEGFTYTDWFHVIIDGYGDRRTAFAFGVNPRGVLHDLRIADDVQQDWSWDAVYEAATSIDTDGWTVEMRIPLSQLRFAPGRDSWGVNFRREIARLEETSHWSPVPPGGATLVSESGILTGLRGLRSPAHVELEPYSAFRVTHEARGAGAAASPDVGVRAQAGGDVRFGLASNLTLSATVNPDFGQVDADPSVVNLSAFEMFFPERRPFFVEGAQMFNFGFGGGANLFYTRRVGRPPQGAGAAGVAAHDVPEGTRILGAAKLTGRPGGEWSLGALSAVTAEERAPVSWGGHAGALAIVEPRAHYGVVRALRDLRGGRSAVGVMLTAVHRDLPADGSLSFMRDAAYALGVDARHRFGPRDDYELMTYVAGSSIAGSTASILDAQRAPGRYFQRPDARHLTLDSTSTTLDGAAAKVAIGKLSGRWVWQVRGTIYSPGFEVNDAGFHQQHDFRELHGDVTRRSFTPGPVFRRWSVAAGAGSGWTFAGERINNYVYAIGDFQLRNYWSGLVIMQHHPPRFSDDVLRGGPLVRIQPNGGYSLSLSTDRRQRVSFGVNGARYWDFGSASDLVPLGASVSVRPSSRMTWSLGAGLTLLTQPAQYLQVDTIAGEPRYLLGELRQSTTSAELRLDYTFTPTLSLQLYAQPFVSAGSYARFRVVEAPTARRFDERFRRLGSGELGYESDGREYRWDADGDGDADATWWNPDFNFRQLRSNVVLRWQWRPGSTLFVAWNQGRTSFDGEGVLVPGRDLSRLFAADGRNVILVKMSYWLGL